jgi:hypothetical protein
MKRTIRRHLRSLTCAVAAVLAVSVHARAEEAACEVPASDYCVCCPPSDCRKEAGFCPGGVSGLVVLKARNLECAVTAWDEATCRGGVVASERRSVVGVYAQGQNARIDLTRAQLAELVEQLEELRP